VTRARKELHDLASSGHILFELVHRGGSLAVDGRNPGALAVLDSRNEWDSRERGVVSLRTMVGMRAVTRVHGGLCSPEWGSCQEDTVPRYGRCQGSTDRRGMHSGLR
jgi:hypothetical protein